MVAMTQENVNVNAELADARTFPSPTQLFVWTPMVLPSRVNTFPVASVPMGLTLISTRLLYCAAVALPRESVAPESAANADPPLVL